MSYPFSPFPENFDHNLIKNLPNTETTSTVSQKRYESTLSWLCTSPNISSYRVNSLKCSPETLIKIISTYFEEKAVLEKNSEKSVSIPIIEKYGLVENVIVIKNIPIKKDEMLKFDKEIIVDVECACAVLRGANIFAPGILGMSSGTKVGEHVSIYADVSGKCKKGLTTCEDSNVKVFIGNGIARMQRYQLFGNNIKLCGIGVSVTENISGCPTLDEHIIPPGLALLQNIPSVLCILSLNPLPGEKVLDLCASPGNKTTHIAELMQNKGILVAIDKTPKKIELLRKKCEIFGATNVHIFQADSTKIAGSVDGKQCKNLTDCPPFEEESFDRILLDAPCSVLGKRPQFANRMSPNEIKSFVPLQRNLIETAVQLLKPNGTLVYSTCTITLAENEGIVAWVLGKFKNMSLVDPKICLGEEGWPGTTLTDADLRKVQRFGPDSVDSVGFFYCVFAKNRGS